MADNDLDLEIRALTLQLQQLKVEQERLERKLNRAQDQIRRRGRGSAEGKTRGAVGTRRPSPVPLHIPSQPSQPSQVIEQKQDRTYYIRNGLRVQEHTYSRTDPPEKGDQVRILNPKKGQCNVGVIIDFCNDGKVKVLTDQNMIIT